MTKLRATIDSLVLSVVLVGLCAAAQIPLPLSMAGSHKGDGTSLSSADQAFLAAAASGSMAEVELGKLAKDHAQSDAVRQFGSRMVDDHSKVNKELTDLATRKGVMLSGDLKDSQKKLRDSLAKLSGPEFDQAYLREMVRSHKADVTAYKLEVAKGQDSELTVWIKQTLPTLQSHLELARETETPLRNNLAQASDQGIP